MMCKPKRRILSRISSAEEDSVFVDDGFADKHESGPDIIFLKEIIRTVTNNSLPPPAVSPNPTFPPTPPPSPTTTARMGTPRSSGMSGIYVEPMATTQFMQELCDRISVNICMKLDSYVSLFANQNVEISKKLQKMETCLMSFSNRERMHRQLLTNYLESVKDT